MPDETRCTGHWSTAECTATGTVHGVAVGSDWQVIPPGPLLDDFYEVTVPDAARQYSAVAVPGAAACTRRSSGSSGWCCSLWLRSRLSPW